MATSSLPTTFFLLSNSSSIISSKPNLSLSFPLLNSKPLSISSSTSSRTPSFTVFAAPEAPDSQQTTLDPAVSQVGVTGDSEAGGPTQVLLEADAHKAAVKQKIRIKLKCFWVPPLEDACKQIMEAARTTNAKTAGPIPLPTKKRVYCVLRSPFVHKNSRFHFEIRTHQRTIDVMDPTPQTIDSLMHLDLPFGVDVVVKL